MFIYILTDSGEHRGCIIKRTGELPLLTSFVWFIFQHHGFHNLVVHFAYVVFIYNHSFNGWKQKWNNLVIFYQDFPPIHFSFAYLKILYFNHFNSTIFIKYYFQQIHFSFSFAIFISFYNYHLIWQFSFNFNKLESGTKSLIEIKFGSQIEIEFIIEFDHNFSKERSIIKIKLILILKIVKFWNKKILFLTFKINWINSINSKIIYEDYEMGFNSTCKFSQLTEIYIKYFTCRVAFHMHQREPSVMFSVEKFECIISISLFSHFNIAVACEAHNINYQEKRST